MQDIVHVGVEYPKPDADLEISANMLAYALSIFRQHIKHGIELEGERNPDSPVLFFDSLRTDGENPAGSTEFGLTGHLVAYTKMVLKLAASDPDGARAEMQQWAESDEVSVALRVWSAGQPCITGISDAESILLSLDDKSFWESRGERDLLMALRDRWHEFTQQTSTIIEERLLYGEIPWLEGRKDQVELEAHYRLCRIYWLKAQKIQLSSQILAQTEKLRPQAPDWNENSIEYTASPRVSMVRELKIDKDSSALTDLPIAEILRTAHSLGEIDARAFRAKQPFRGLAETKPSRAICAIKRAAYNGEFYPWAWNAVLQTTANSLVSSFKCNTANDVGCCDEEELQAFE
ncbi:hypothetical protein, partial [Pandoraea soli]|uniref:hypothetical protein n=1 Tax=Pandoraea soli TaxID=2508293 RepID=UPI001FE37DBE